MEHLIDFFDRYIRGSSPSARLRRRVPAMVVLRDDQLRATAEAFAGRLTMRGCSRAIGC